MTTRTVVWTIVGLLVVATIIFHFAVRRGFVEPRPRKMEEEDYRKYQSRAEERLARFEERYTKKVREIANPTPEQKAKMDEILSLVDSLKRYLAEYANLTTDEERKEWHKKCRTTEREMRKAYRTLIRLEKEKVE